MVCQHLEEIYELYLLQALSPEDAARVREHVEFGCANCLERLREAALSICFLCLSTPPARPAPKHKKQLLERLRPQKTPMIKAGHTRLTGAR
jgi:hypothetical protein